MAFVLQYYLVVQQQLSNYSNLVLGIETATPQRRMSEELEWKARHEERGEHPNYFIPESRFVLPDAKL